MLTQSQMKRVLEVYQQMRGLECLSSCDCLFCSLPRGRRAEQCWGGPPADRLFVFGYHLTGSTGTLFLFGIAVGAVASLGLCLLVTGTRPTQALPI
jgi:hypothetical protein